LAGERKRAPVDSKKVFGEKYGLFFLALGDEVSGLK
jgi:hypothetical protein